MFQWKNLNSFVARLTSAEYSPWLNLPIWQLRTALENEPQTGANMDCRLWVASEWILQSGELLFEEMSSNRDLDQQSARAIETGPTFESKPPLSVERWQFWRDRFLDISKNKADLELDSSIVSRISSTVQRMDTIREKSS